MSDKPKSVVELAPYLSIDACPQELIEQLERIHQAAKDGKLVSCVVAYQISTDTELNEGGQFMWRNDGRMDSLHSECHLLAHRALQAIEGNR